MKRILSFIAAFFAALIAAACGKSTSPDQLTVSFIDVGKGDCILAECGGSTLMIDTGYAETTDRVLGYLSERGVEKLDALIITHYDKDHVGGAAGIASVFPTGKIYLPDYESGSDYYGALMGVIREKGIDTVTVGTDTSVSVGSAEFTIYASGIKYDSSGKEGNDNDVSLVTSAKHGKDSYLFTGDIEKDGIKSFLKKFDGTCGVLKMPHHGRKESNTDKLIEATEPKYAVITDSVKEPADKKVISLLDGIEVYRSSVCGDIVMESKGDGKYTVRTEK